VQFQYEEAGVDGFMFTLTGTDHESTASVPVKSSGVTSALSFLSKTGSNTEPVCQSHLLVLKVGAEKDRKQWVDAISKTCAQGMDRRKSFFHGRPAALK